MNKIENLIINSPYEMPTNHWQYDQNTREYTKVKGRRTAGYRIASTDNRTVDDPGTFVPLNRVTQIRKYVDAWRSAQYPHVTGITKKLLDFWNDPDVREIHRFYFCQLEAIETLIWLTEYAGPERHGIKIPDDGGDFARLCCKMATGTGKTVVMAMAIAWQVINHVTYQNKGKFTKNILIMAPGLTVKSRLRVLDPKEDDNFYKLFRIIPDELVDKLNQCRIKIHNWHTLVPENDEKFSVVKLGKESDKAFSKRILEHDSTKILVINDESHHAYRAKPDDEASDKDVERDKLWMEGLDKIHADRTILHCFDFSATPFRSSGKKITKDTVFEWVVSDFSLNDAIESGLTKTPRIPAADDSKVVTATGGSRFYHLYMDDDVESDLKRQTHEEEPLPDLVKQAYEILGKSWHDTFKLWNKSNRPIPPVMITVCNNTSTAARIEYSFKHSMLGIKELSDEGHLLRIDSNILKKAESEGSNKAAESLRELVYTVGKVGESGGQIRNIISIAMLSEGWDAQNVTHIMGLRAFSSQLLCEQVVGRGLRRTSHEVNKNGLFESEYVEVFGVPFSFMPHEGKTNAAPEIKPTFEIRVESGRQQYEISWPNIERVHTEYTYNLSINWDAVKPLNLKSGDVSTSVSVAPILEGKPDFGRMSEIDLKGYEGLTRQQEIIFMTARDIYNEIAEGWIGHKGYLMAQVVKIIERFIFTDKITISGIDDSIGLGETRRLLTMVYNMKAIGQHIAYYIEQDSKEKQSLILHQKKFRSTSDMYTWNSRKKNFPAKKSQINLSVYDSDWETVTGQDLDRHPHVSAWVKNSDPLGFKIPYRYKGILHNYLPDFLIRLKNHVMLVLEVKGEYDDEDKAKRQELERWVQIVNKDGGFGTWASDILFDKENFANIIQKHLESINTSNEYAQCPKCGINAEGTMVVREKFGHVNSSGIMIPQLLCMSCRSHNPKF